MFDNIEIPPAPDGLSDNAVAFWVSVHEVTPLNEYERSILTQICKALTKIDELEGALQADGRYTIKGVQGSTVINPLFTEIRMQQNTVDKLYRTLKLNNVLGEVSSGKDVPVVDPNVIDMIERARNRKAN